MKGMYDRRIFGLRLLSKKHKRTPPGPTINSSKINLSDCFEDRKNGDAEKSPALTSAKIFFLRSHLFRTIGMRGQTIKFS
jgi:hypothetical protein